MRLVVDASTLVSTSLRVRGRRLLSHPFLDLVVATEMWSETTHELEKRLVILVRRGHVVLEEGQSLLERAESLIPTRLVIAPQHVYQDRLEEALLRIPRDPGDAPTVALALILDCGIWTNDRDFFGCGLPFWATDVLQLHLESSPKIYPSERLPW
jgi:predicted nucleic acid-binding protein